MITDGGRWTKNTRRMPLAVAAAALALAPPDVRVYGERAPVKSITRTERDRRKAKKRAAKESRRRNRR